MPHTLSDCNSSAYLRFAMYKVKEIWEALTRRIRIRLLHGLRRGSLRECSPRCFRKWEIYFPFIIILHFPLLDCRYSLNQWVFWITAGSDRCGANTWKKVHGVHVVSSSSSEGARQWACKSVGEDTRNLKKFLLAFPSHRHLCPRSHWSPKEKLGYMLEWVTHISLSMCLPTQKLWQHLEQAQLTDRQAKWTDRQM